MLEVMVAVGIRAIIATFAGADRYLDRAKSAQAVSELMEIANRIKTYELNNRKLPDALSDIGRGRGSPTPGERLPTVSTLRQTRATARPGSARTSNP
jgi:Tfp pilus assembly protein PilE